LTVISNRRRFSAAAEGRTRPTSALLYIDLDRLMAINDVVARLRCDEFGALLSDVDAATAEMIARRVFHVIGQPPPCVLGPESASASGGLAFASANDHVLDSADMVMFSGKRAGRSRLAIT
jgi:GGDEF domain-containing protein